jgi:hypothetical protein
MQGDSNSRTVEPIDLIIPFSIALTQLAIQMLTNGNYGYFRDELYYIACSKHLAFGYVDQPPLSAAVLALVRWTLGDSLQAIRFLPALAISATAMLAALMAHRLGGGRFATSLASLCVVGAHLLLGQGRYFSMNSFDVFFWALSSYIVIRILTGDSPRLWLVFGLVVGLGLLNKYSVGFLCIGIVAGLLLTQDRSQLKSKWFWLGVVAASVLFLPHVLWELKNGYPSLEFMGNASQQKNAPITLFEFIQGQFFSLNYFTAPVWLLGLAYFFFNHRGRELRVFGWSYVVVFVIMVVGNGKVYYLAPIYPILFAGGAVFLERFILDRSLNWIRPVLVTLILVWTLVGAPFSIPVLPIKTFIAYQKILGVTPKSEERTAVGVLPQGYADEFGWEEFVAVIASAYHKLTPEEQAKCVIYVRNYGEAGAVDFFGPKYGLPNALCAHNSYWYWGPGEKTGDVAIILGGSRALQDNLNDLNRRYKYVELAGTTKIDYCMPYENGRSFFICKGMNTSFQKLWPEERHFI